MGYQALEKLLTDLTDSGTIPAITMAVGQKGKLVYSGAFGKIYENDERIVPTSRFDIASMTKIFSGVCFMKLAEQGKIGLHDPICNIFPELDTVKPIEEKGVTVGQCDASKVTWLHVLTHTSGMGFTRPMPFPTLPHLDKGLDDIFTLPFAYPPGTRVAYNDMPLILLGVAMERVSGRRLDELVDELICRPMGLLNTGYLRRSAHPSRIPGVVPTEEDTRFRKQRVWGAVHDENAFLLDGVSGHAGIFSTAEDICGFALRMADCLKEDGLLKRATAEEMIREYAEEDGDRRGIAWQLSIPGEASYTKYLSHNAYGHSGFTGCFFWNDPEKDLSVVLLSNDVYSGRENRKLFDVRGEIMRLAVEGSRFPGSGD